MLVAAMNPCPCGYLGDPSDRCQCHPRDISRYRARISGPLLDRIDIHVEAPAVRIEELRRSEPGESSQAIRERIEAARDRQRFRLNSFAAHTNAQMGPSELRRFCTLSEGMGDQLQETMERLRLSARAYDRILKVARTVADLDESDEIRPEHLAEAIHYRSLDRQMPDEGGGAL